MDKKRFVVSKTMLNNQMVSMIEMSEGHIRIAENCKYAGGRNSIISFFIKPEYRGRKLSFDLLNAAKRRYDDLSAQASNEVSVRSLYKSGFRRFGAVNKKLSDLVVEVNEYPNSILMVWNKS